jgi:hypothetical protein
MRFRRLCGSSGTCSRPAVKLATNVATEGLKFEDLEIDGEVEAFIEDLIDHVGEPGTPGN